MRAREQKVTACRVTLRLEVSLSTAKHLRKRRQLRKDQQRTNFRMHRANWANLSFYMDSTPPCLENKLQD
jgi:hypothetical protein